MNREIKFRGKRTENGQWIYGNLIQKEGYAAIIQFHEPSPYNEYLELEVVPESVGQFTEEMDGETPVFEGDILYWKWDESLEGHTIAEGVCLFEVVFKDCRWQLRDVRENEHFPLDDCQWDYIEGNIHDNPELLPENAILSPAKTTEP